MKAIFYIGGITLIGMMNINRAAEVKRPYNSTYSAVSHEGAQDTAGPVTTPNLTVSQTLPAMRLGVTTDGIGSQSIESTGINPGISLQIQPASTQYVKPRVESIQENRGNSVDLTSAQLQVTPPKPNTAENESKSKSKSDSCCVAM